MLWGACCAAAVSPVSAPRTSEPDVCAHAFDLLVEGSPICAEFTPAYFEQCSLSADLSRTDAGRHLLRQGTGWLEFTVTKHDGHTTVLTPSQDPPYPYVQEHEMKRERMLQGVSGCAFTVQHLIDSRVNLSFRLEHWPTEHYSLIKDYDDLRWNSR